MRKIILVVVLLVLAVSALSLIPSETVIEQQSTPEVVEKTIIEEVPQLDNRIIDAINASSTAIEEEAKKAYEERKQQLETQIKLEVTRAYKQEIDARVVALEKQTKEY